MRSRELESLALWLKESKVHHSSNFKSPKKRYFCRIIEKYVFEHAKEYAEAFLNHVKEKLNLTDVYIEEAWQYENMW